MVLVAITEATLVGRAPILGAYARFACVYVLPYPRAINPYSLV